MDLPNHIVLNGKIPIEENWQRWCVEVQQDKPKKGLGQNYGIPFLPNFDSRPTYKYTTPHNIIKWTSRTKVNAGKQCYEACHIVTESDGTVRNKELYLFNSDLLPWEINADKNIVVDGKLPAKWGINN